MLAGLAVLALAMGGTVWLAYRTLHRREASPQDNPMAGYVSDVGTVEREYSAAHGKLLDNVEVRTLFERAATLAHARRYKAAADLLESAAKSAAVPVIFNDLGVLYAQLGDRARTLAAFREALARDSNYEPVLGNLVRLQSITGDEAMPLARELEPNPTNASANVIAVNSQVEGEIAAGVGDIDTFKFPAPPPPRDILAIDIVARAPDLIVGWSLSDGDGNLVARVGQEHTAGAAAHYSFVPAPGATFYLSLWGVESTSGAYTISLKTLRAFDAQEPNDDIFHAHPMALGETIQANIMDGQDQDFYSFQPDRSGTVDVDLKNGSPTLVPGLTAFGPDQRTIGFAPDASGPGASLHYSFAVEAGKTYYIQVWPVLDRSSGDYSLRAALQ